ncbi:MAG: SDR family NAD(P)-dependent oxidoreductase, partial [Acidimicrobiales bacterium]
MTDQSNPLDLSGRVAVVTGGTKGLGRVIATTLLAAGADVLVCARNQPESVPEADARAAVFA